MSYRESPILEAVAVLIDPPILERDLEVASCHRLDVPDAHRLPPPFLSSFAGDRVTARIVAVAVAAVSKKGRDRLTVSLHRSCFRMEDVELLQLSGAVTYPRENLGRVVARTEAEADVSLAH